MKEYKNQLFLDNLVSLKRKADQMKLSTDDMVYLYEAIANIDIGEDAREKLWSRHEELETSDDNYMTGEEVEEEIFARQIEIFNGDIQEYLNDDLLNRYDAGELTIQDFETLTYYMLLTKR